MTAKQMKLMVDEINYQSHSIETRMDLEDKAYDLWQGLEAAGLTEQAKVLRLLYDEMELVPTEEIIKLHIFNK